MYYDGHDDALTGGEAHFINHEIIEKVYKGEESLTETYHEVREEFCESRQELVAGYVAENFVPDQEREEFLSTALEQVETH